MTGDPQTEYDVVVIGGGATGENVAGRAVRGGLTAALVERELLGGECSYWACMPSKALLRDAEVLAQARSLPGAGAAVTGTLDPAKVLTRRDGFASHWSDDGQLAWAQGAGIDVVRGHARLVGERAVEVTGPDGERRRLTARHAVVLATGSVPVLPPVPGLRESRPWTSREGTSAQAVPPRLLVLGGGVAGCELATAWSALGSTVTLVERGPTLLAHLEPFAGELVGNSLRSSGIDVRVGVGATQVRRDGDGPSTVSLDDGGTLTIDAVLVVTGRRAATDDLGVETVGLTPGAYVEVDDTLRATGVAGGWLYAAGDVNGRRLLTHMGKYQARCAAEAIVVRASGGTAEPAVPWAASVATADGPATPGVVFTDPPVAAVGLTAEQARAAGLDVRVVDYDIGAVAGASVLGEDYVGKARMVVDETRRVVVGATFVGRETAELLHSATVAIVGEVQLDRLWHAVPSYPTVSEVWLRLLETYGL